MGGRYGGRIDARREKSDWEAPRLPRGFLAQGGLRKATEAEIKRYASKRVFQSDDRARQDES